MFDPGVFGRSEFRLAGLGALEKDFPAPDEPDDTPILVPLNADLTDGAMALSNQEVEDVWLRTYLFNAGVGAVAGLAIAAGRGSPKLLYTLLGGLLGVVASMSFRLVSKA